jgi:hypothetical protein
LIVKRKLDERIPEIASINGDYVMDIFQDRMFTASDLKKRRYHNQDLFPVYDAKNGKSIGKMNPNTFIDKMLGDIL